MRTVSVTVFRQNLPRYLAMARRGVRVRVTSRGAPVAELTPATPDRGAAQAARALLSGSVRSFERPLEPAIDPGEWDVEV